MIRIFNLKKKIDINSVVTKSESRILRLLRLDRSFATSIVDQVEEDRENVSEDHRKEIRNAILQAEYMKAKATIAMQYRRFY